LRPSRTGRLHIGNAAQRAGRQINDIEGNARMSAHGGSTAISIRPVGGTAHHAAALSSTITGRNRWVSRRDRRPSISRANPPSHGRCPARRRLAGRPTASPGSDIPRDGSARGIRPARREPRDLQTCSTDGAPGPCTIPIWPPLFCQGDQRLDISRMAGARFRACGLRSWCRCRPPDLAVEGDSNARARRQTGFRVRVWCWRKGESLFGAAALLARSIGRPRNTSWPNRDPMPAASYPGSARASIGWPVLSLRILSGRSGRRFQAQVLSLIYERRVRQISPGLKVVLMESGVSWLPGLHVARTTRPWRGVRVEVPWIGPRAGGDHGATTSA